MSEITNEQLQMRQLFGVPIFKKRFEKHSEFKNQVLEYFKDKENFRKTTNRPNLLFTSPNLHREEIFRPYSEFFIESLKEVMEFAGFVPSIEFTGMWGTIHPNGGFHHRHTHYNSFLAGVYYFDGTPECSGTTFYNPISYHNLIVPKFANRSILNSLNEYTTPFDEGVLIIFPAWLSHTTQENYVSKTKAYRKILSFNAMPVGSTNCDLFDRYNYPNISSDTSLPSYSTDIIGNEDTTNWSLVDSEPYFKQFETKEEGQ